MKPNLKIAGIDFYKQSARRSIVVLTYVSCLLLVYCLWLGSASGAGAIKLLALVPFFGLALGWWVLNQVAVSYTDSPRRRVDERQAQVRDRAFFRAYQIICAMISFYLFYEMVASTAPRFSLWHPATSAEYGAVIYLFLVVSITLPHAFISWWEPDFEAEGQELALSR